MTREGGSFGLKLNFGARVLKDFSATETTLRFTVTGDISVDTYDMRREGDQLVGTATSAIGGFDDRSVPVRMVRK